MSEGGDPSPPAAEVKPAAEVTPVASTRPGAVPAQSSNAGQGPSTDRALGSGLAQRRRPSAVTVVAVTYIVLSAVWLALSIQALISAQILLPPGGGILDATALRSHIDLLGAIVAVRQGAAGVTAFFAGIALLRMHPRGWLLGMVAAVIVLAVQLVSWYDSTPNYTLMGITVVVVLLMNQAEVRDAFGEGTMA